MDQQVTHSSSSTSKPLAIWRWGFSIALAGVGLWLILSQPDVVGGDGRVLGWILLGYAVIRLLFSFLMNLSRGTSWRRS